MSQPQNSKQITELQTLSLLPDPETGSSSAAIYALIRSLKETAKHRSCVGIYFIRAEEDSCKIVIISKWSQKVDASISKAYVTDIIPHLKTLPQPIIELDRSLYGFSLNNVSHFLTVYFPVSSNIESSQGMVSARVKEFIDEAHLLNSPGYLRSISPAWLKESQIIDGVHVRGFMLHVVWTNRQSEMNFKAQSTIWTSLIQDFWAMGSFREEEYHGTLVPVKAGTQIAFNLPGDSKLKKKTEEELVSQRFDRITASGSTTSIQRTGDDHLGCVASLDPQLPLRNDQLSRTRARLELIYSRLAERISFCEKSQKEFDLESEDESPCTTPILTPSSSTTSLSTLYEKSEPGQARWESLISKNYQFESSSSGSDPSDSDSDSDIELNLESMRNRLNALVPPNRNKPNQIHTHWTSGRSHCDAELTEEHAKRYGVARWNAEEEIREAQSRFRRYGKRGADLRSAITNEYLPEAETDEEDKAAEHHKIPWWKSLTGLLKRRDAMGFEDLEEGIPATLKMHIPGSFVAPASADETLPQVGRACAKNRPKSSLYPPGSARGLSSATARGKHSRLVLSFKLRVL